MVTYAEKLQEKCMPGEEHYLLPKPGKGDQLRSYCWEGYVQTELFVRARARYQQDKSRHLGIMYHVHDGTCGRGISSSLSRVIE